MVSKYWLMEACWLEEPGPLLLLKGRFWLQVPGAHGRSQGWAEKCWPSINICWVWNLLETKECHQVPPASAWNMLRAQGEVRGHSFSRLAPLPPAAAPPLCPAFNAWAEIASNHCPRQVSVKTSQDFHSFYFFLLWNFFLLISVNFLVKLSGQFWKGIKPLSLLPSWSQTLFWFI